MTGPALVVLAAACTCCGHDWHWHGLQHCAWPLCDCGHPHPWMAWAASDRG